VVVTRARPEKGRPHDRPAFVSRHRQHQPGRRPAASGAAALEDGRAGRTAAIVVLVIAALAVMVILHLTGTFGEGTHGWGRH